MKKIFAINGSPRKNGSTAKLLKRALEGAESAGAETKPGDDVVDADFKMN